MSDENRADVKVPIGEAVVNLISDLPGVRVPTEAAVLAQEVSQLAVYDEMPATAIDDAAAATDGGTSSAEIADEPRAAPAAEEPTAAPSSPEDVPQRPAETQGSTSVEDKKVSPYATSKLPLALQAIFPAPPVIAGEDIAAYVGYLDLLIEERKPQSVNDYFQIKNIVDSDLQATRAGKAAACLLNAAIATSLRQRIVDNEIENVIEGQPEAASDKKSGSRVEHELSRTLQHQIKREAFNAVSGNKDAIAYVEKKIGAGKVAVGPEAATEIERYLPSQLIVERLTTAAHSRINAAYATLEASALKRASNKSAAVPQTEASRSASEEPKNISSNSKGITR